jgi:ABC-type branched-subunit amino acid transport system ATPase component
MTTSAPVDTATVLEAEDIDFSYGRLQVLFGVSLRVAQGEALALLGTNGAGKSTLLRVLSGLEPPTRGRVRLEGVDVTGIEAEDLVGRGLVLIPGGRAVFPDMTVEENLELQALTVRTRADWVRGQRERIYELFPRVAQRLHQPAGSLSGGEQQQVALAKAILLEPSVLCIDELSLGLAPIVVQELLEVVRGINAAGVAVVLVEQSLNIASQLCTRAVFMEKGTVRFEGRPSELLERDDLARAVFLGGTEDGRP